MGLCFRCKKCGYCMCNVLQPEAGQYCPKCGREAYDASYSRIGKVEVMGYSAFVYKIELICPNGQCENVWSPEEFNLEAKCGECGTFHRLTSVDLNGRKKPWWKTRKKS